MRDKKNQIGGDHYSKRKIQPFDIIDEYGLDYYEGAALKYLLRHKDKNGKEDLEKMKDYADCIIDRHYPENDFTCTRASQSMRPPVSTSNGYWECSHTEEKPFESAFIYSPKSLTDCYRFSTDSGHFYGVCIDSYAFKNYLTDEQMKGATGEYSYDWQRADELSVTTEFTIDELVLIFEDMRLLADEADVFYNSSAILDEMIPLSCGDIVRLKMYIYGHFAKRCVGKTLTI